jgi:hypothetical protein
MPIRIRQLFPLVKLGKNICSAYRARLVEAIRLCKKLEKDSDSVAGYGSTKDDDGVHNHNHNHNQPGTVQDVDIDVDVW